MRVSVVVDLFVQFVNQPVKMGNQLFDAFDLRFVNLMQTVFLGSPHIHQLVAAVDQCFQHFFRFGGRVVEHGLPIFFLHHHLCEEGEHLGIFGIGFGQRLRLGKLMRLTRVGNDDGYACAVDGFGGGTLRPSVLSMTTRATLCFFRYSTVWAIPLGLLVSVLVLDKDETAMTKFRLAMSMPAQLYWVLIINLSCIRLCCLATVRLCRWVARPLPELLNGCLPWSDAGGDRAVCCYDTGVSIYKVGFLNPTFQIPPR